MKKLCFYGALSALVGCSANSRAAPISQHFVDGKHQLKIERINGIKIELWNTLSKETQVNMGGNWRAEGTNFPQLEVDGPNKSRLILPLEQELNLIGEIK